MALGKQANYTKVLKDYMDSLKEKLDHINRDSPCGPWEDGVN